MPPYEAVLFDKDGTLFDFAATWGNWTRELVHDLGGGDPARARDLALAIGYDLERAGFAPESPVIAHTPVEIAEALLPLLPGAAAGELVERMNALSAAATQVPVGDLALILDGLRGRGLRLGLVTNDAEAPARAHLARAGVLERFDFVAGSDSGFGAKPDPGPLLAFARLEGLRPDRVVMVGDSRHDLQAGRAAGMATVGVLTGLADRAALSSLADAVLPDIGHLAGWLDVMAAR
ncbi:MAG: HAD family hydrolase [Rhodobacteraceae bacterium]|nr:HAD family hydrolase [Paracoccaceae bacterium]